MSAAKHTPGPCPHVYGGGSLLSTYYTMGRDGKPCPTMLASDSSARAAWQRGKAERAANAALIAAAPDLLAALERAANALLANSSNDQAYHAARAVIKQARGEA